MQLDHLNKESERLSEEKPEEAAAVDEKIVTLTALWQELKDTVCANLHLNSFVLESMPYLVQLSFACNT